MRLFSPVVLILLCLLAAPDLALAQPLGPRHVDAQLVSRDRIVAPGQTTYVALRQKITPGWHTYWRNAGDAGEPTSLTWTLPKGWAAGDIVWALPKREVTGPLTDFGYEGEVLLPVPIKVPENAPPGTTQTIKATASFLVCQEVCVPESADLSVGIQVGRKSLEDPLWAGAVATALAAAPKPAGLAATYRAQGGKLLLSIAGPALAGGDFSQAWFYPYAGGVVSHHAEQPVERGAQGLTLTLTPSPGVAKTGPPNELIGVIAVAGRGYEVTAKAGEGLPNASGLGPPPVRPSGGPGGLLAILGAMLSAFLGGVILNLMPCVFPVLSMKAASLAGHGGEAAGARRQGLAFLGGVVMTFLALAGGLLALKAGGQALGWGFQLQSPAVVAGLSLVMLLTALNLSGVFEIGASVQGIGQGLASRSGLIGAVFTGALAVVVAAPCTAPFMGPALGFALVQPAPVALAVFLGLALGFAGPFTVLAFTPALLRRLPRPGAWMDGLKHALAFPMYASAAWLAWVLAQQAGSLGLARLFAAGLAAAFGAWLVGVRQRRSLSGGGGWLSAVQGGGGAFALVVAFVVALVAPDQPATLVSEPWSPSRVAALQAEGRPVLVNFTAAWCVTCQVNDRVAIDTAGAARAMRAANAVYLVGDWTNRNAQIAQALAEHGRAGVPLYLVYPASGGAPKVLPQILTERLVVEAVADAARK